MESNQTGIQKIVKKWNINSTFFYPAPRDPNLLGGVLNIH
jgi:hypothetical protein